MVNGGRESTSKIISPSKYEVGYIDILMAKVNALSLKIDKMEKAKVNDVSTPSPCCELRGMQGHSTMECQTMMPADHDEQVENVASTHNFYDYPRKRKFDPYLSTINEGWKIHPNFFYHNN